jgi:hypothetical protein
VVLLDGEPSGRRGGIEQSEGQDGVVVRGSENGEGFLCRFSFFNKVGSKDNVLSRLNPIEWGMTSASI